MSVDELTRIGWRRVGNVWVAPEGVPEPKGAELKEYVQPAKAHREVAPCGTQSAYRRHSRRGETCLRCESLKNDNLKRPRP